MDPTQPGVNALFAYFGAIAIMGAWDGLVRHHIRVRPSEQLFSLFIEGPLAIIMGAFCLLVLLLLSELAATGLPAQLTGCRTLVCPLERVVLLPFTTVGSLFILALTGGLFIPWLRGMFDLEGPFRTRLLAPGIWYREREVVTLAQQSLQQQQQHRVATKVILELADSLLRTFHGVSPTTSTSNASAPLPTREMIVQSLAHSSLVHKRDGASLVAQRIIIESIAPYIVGNLEAAERRWPWRRRFFKLFP